MTRIGTFLPAALLALLLVIVPARALEPDGLSFERAIPIVAQNSVEGVPKEYEYLRRHYPGWRRTMQALLRHEGRTYDRLTIVSPAGETKDIYFDITSFFGKM